MTNKEFVKIIRNRVLYNILEHYNSIINSRLENCPTDTSKHFFEFFNSMSDGDKEILCKLNKFVIVDTISTLLGILDGTTILREHREDFSLTYGDQPERINRYLLDYF